MGREKKKHTFKNPVPPPLCIYNFVNKEKRKNKNRNERMHLSEIKKEMKCLYDCSYILHLSVHWQKLKLKDQH